MADQLARQWIAEHGEARVGELLAMVEAHTPTQRDADRRLFLSRIDDPLAREDFAQRGWRSGLNATAIATFWEEMEPGAFDGV